jgi:hypothetical protein
MSQDPSKEIAKRPRGNPTVYTPEKAEIIIDALKNGIGVNEACRLAGVPRGTLMEWVTHNREGFAELYANARDLYLDLMADELLRLTDECPPEPGFVAKTRLQVDTRKWYLSKLAPKRYSDRIDVTTNGKDIPAAIQVLAYLPNNGRSQADEAPDE